MKRGEKIDILRVVFQLGIYIVTAGIGGLIVYGLVEKPSRNDRLMEQEAVRKEIINSELMEKQKINKQTVSGGSIVRLTPRDATLLAKGKVVYFNIEKPNKDHPLKVVMFERNQFNNVLANHGLHIDYGPALKLIDTKITK